MAMKVETKSGLSYRDIEVGSGPKPPKGFQITVNAVMMVEEQKELRPFVNSLQRGFPIEFRIGTGSVDYPNSNSNMQHR